MRDGNLNQSMRIFKTDKISLETLYTLEVNTPLYFKVIDYLHIL